MIFKILVKYTCPSICVHNNAHVWQINTKGSSRQRNTNYTPIPQATHTHTHRHIHSSTYRNRKLHAIPT